MDPREERAAVVLVEPFDCFRGHFAAGTLHGVEARVDAISGEVEVVVVAIESLGDAPAMVEHERRDESARSIAPPAQECGAAR